ncbi:MAG: hypothetical protein EZS28_047696 [Streblomastix strix]|uniref:Uncharacterized protein n=1 Tax=Streblomastix strix TaxID=222440 RepID=A0A5J4TF48_9EUKA|nr:MAG: hypothetical protein EZS28_047696 [Streblomastix strix]
MELTDSVFIEPSCYSNMIYLKRTLGTIEDYAFSTKVFGLRVDKGTSLLNKISFIEAEISEGDYYDGSLLLLQFTGNSNVDIKEAIVIRKSEDDQMYFSNNENQKKKKKEK